MARFICIHGHFYQPPRENPWLEAVETQDSAFPYHDWNERVTAECYAPNSASRILDGECRITDIISNYAKISFNFGPNLLSWMERSSPEVYTAILDADRQSMSLRAGHGAAIAQVYSHLIMPLAASRDKRTQVLWGISDFEHRFKRFPEGMWLAETAVDLETLDILAEQGIKFTILAPHQAARVRKTGSGRWKDLGEEGIDPTRGYLCRLPSRRTITLFFYDAPISRAVAFEKLLENGEGFAKRLMEGFSEARDWPQLLHIATDGETYGHHHRFGDMALAAALNQIETDGLARLTNYGEYLDHHPPTHEVQIREYSSWSCSHGVERWRSNCGCSSGGHPGWNQEWRAPLRDAFDWLRDELAAGYERRGREFLKDPWLARDEYIEVILDQSLERAERFLVEHAVRRLTNEEKSFSLRLLEMERHLLLMYTSCGWFFDELTGIETVQVIQYAGRALQLAEGVVGDGLENAFLERLRQAQSNLPEHGDGSRIYDLLVKPARVDLTKVAAHYAFSSLFEEYGEEARIFRYTVVRKDYVRLTSNDASLAVGKIAVVSAITEEESRLVFCVGRFGSHDFKGGICPFTDAGTYDAMKAEIGSAFDKGFLTEMIGLMDKYCGRHDFSLAHLFRDERRKILNLIITAAREELSAAYRDMYEHNHSLMEFVQESGLPVPRAFLTAAESALGDALRQALAEKGTDAGKVRKIVDQVKRWRVAFDSPDIEFVIRRNLEGVMRTLYRTPSDFSLLARIKQLIELLQEIPLELVYWQIQNIYYRLAKTAYLERRAIARAGDDGAVGWVEAFSALGELLFFNVTVVLPDGERHDE